MLLCSPTLDSELNWRFAYNQQNAREVTLWFLRVSQKKLHSFQLSLLGGLLQRKPVTRKKSICHELTDAVRNPKLAKQRTHVKRQGSEKIAPTHIQPSQAPDTWIKKSSDDHSLNHGQGKNMRGPKMSLTVTEPWEMFRNSLVGNPGGAAVKNLPASAGDVRDAGSIPGSGRSPGGGHGNPLQYSSLETPLDRGAWRATVHRVTKNRTQLK